MTASLIVKINNVVRGVKQRWGTAAIKRAQWNKEYGTGYWDFIDNTPDDSIYRYIAKYSAGGNILDLGCGSGNTGCELDVGSYRAYTGIDISDDAVAKASKRSDANGRKAKNQYFRSEIEIYVPDRPYDVILFRESIAYVPLARVRQVLERYAGHLTPNGVFIIRWSNQAQGEAILARVKPDYVVRDKVAGEDHCPFLVVLQRHADKTGS